MYVYTKYYVYNCCFGLINTMHFYIHCVILFLGREYIYESNSTLKYIEVERPINHNSASLYSMYVLHALSYVLSVKL